MQYEKDNAITKKKKKKLCVAVGDFYGYCCHNQITSKIITYHKTNVSI